MYSMINGLSRQNSYVSNIRIATILCLWGLAAGTVFFVDKVLAMDQVSGIIDLPIPKQDSKFSLERALRERRSVRSFRHDPITLEQLSQLLWAAQGITNSRGYRTVPSAGGLYPLEIYVMAGDVKGLPVGMFKYQPDGHRLRMIESDDRRKQMEAAALGQTWVRKNAALIVFSTDDSRATRKYGKRGVRYVHIEVGHAAQNILLQAQALGIGVTAVGAFNDKLAGKILELSGNEQVLYLMPIGKRRIRKRQ